ncbi:hypothetical protein BC342_34860 [Streptomyces olivaceus]|nr:hypothetical protein BC342_34860 [Streptomyces olivaceus]
MKSSAEEPGDVYAAAGDRPQSEAGQVGDTVGGAVLGVGVVLPCDLLAGDGVEETVAVVRNDHDQVVSALGMRREADAEQSANRDAVRVLEDGAPWRGRGNDRGGEQSVAQRPLIGGERRLTDGLPRWRRLLVLFRHVFMISCQATTAQNRVVEKITA